MNQSTVLIVDDEANVRRALYRLLQAPDRKVLQAESGEAALELMLEHPVDVVLSDMQMPGIDGAELLSRIKQPHTRKIVLTGFADTERAMAAINEGAVNRYLTKPWQNTELVNVVDEEVQQAHKMQQDDRLFASLKEHVDKLQSRMDISTNLLNVTSAALQERQYESVSQFGHILFRAHCPLKASLANKVASRLDALGTLLLLGEEQQTLLKDAAALHRLGELAMPAEIVAKPFYQMSVEESAQYALYPAYSASLVASDQPMLRKLVSQHRTALTAESRKTESTLSQLLELTTEYEEMCLFTATQGLVKTFVQKERGHRYDACLVDALLASMSV